MKRVRALCAAALLAAWGVAWAQPAAAPHFVAPNLSPAGVRALAANCAPCHGTEGRPVPRSALAALAGRKREALAAALHHFKEGSVPATVMHQIAKGYSDAELDAIAGYFAGLRP